MIAVQGSEGWFDSTLALQFMTTSRENGFSLVLDISKMRIFIFFPPRQHWLVVDISSLLCLFLGDSTSVLPLAFLWQPLALQGCHITPSSLCCLSFPSFTVSLSLSPASPLPLCMCHVTCVLQRCHYWAAGITLPPMSCLSARSASCHTRSLSLSLSLSLLTLLLVCCPWRFYITFIH